MNSKNRVVKVSRNLAMYWIAFFFGAVVSFFLSPYVVKQLGNSAYGVWTLLVAVVGYLGLLDFGVRGAVTRYVAHHNAVGDVEKSSNIVSAALVMFAFFGAIAIIISVSLAWLSPVLFNIPMELLADTRIVLVIGGSTMAITLLGAVFGGVLTGLERFDINSTIEIFVTAIRTIAVVVALSRGYGLVTLATIHFISSIVTGIAAFIAVRKHYPQLGLRFSIPLLPHMRTILSFSVFLSAIHFLGFLIYYSDALVIAMFLPISAVTYFAIAGNLVEYARQVAAALSQLTTPRVSALASTGSDHMAAEVLASARYATLITAPIAAVFFFRGEPFINLWMGAEYGQASGEILRVLAFVVFLGGGRSVSTSALTGLNKHRTLIPIFAMEAACNLALSLFLVQHIGLVGVAIGTLIPSAIIGVVFVPQRLSMAIGAPLITFYFNVWLRPALACLPFAVANILMESHFPATSLLIFFTQVSLSLPLVFVCTYIFCLSAGEKKTIVSAIHLFAMRFGGGRE